VGERWLSRTVHETGQPGRVRLIGDAVAAMICHLPRYMASFDRSTRSPSGTTHGTSPTSASFTG